MGRLGIDPKDPESGSSVVGFVLVAPLLVSIFVAISQVLILVADKTVLTSAATIGARSAGASDASLGVGVTEAKQVLAGRGNLATKAQVSVEREQISGVSYVRMTISSRVIIPWLNQGFQISSTSRALDEHAL